jgi:hypothetical protein
MKDYDLKEQHGECMVHLIGSLGKKTFIWCLLCYRYYDKDPIKLYVASLAITLCQGKAMHDE